MLVERDEELARCEQGLEAAASGRGGLVLIEGPAGIGKSRVLHAARDRALAHGLTVLTARGGELERDFAYGVVRQLFERPLLELSDDERAEVLSGAAELARPVLDGGSDAGADAARADSSFAVLHGLYWLASNLASGGRGVVMLVDDLHWADAPSQRFLLYLAARLDGLPLAVIAAARPTEPGADQPMLAQLAADPSAAVLRPRPLSEDGVAALLADRLAPDPVPEGVAQACHDATGGNPFLLRELLAALEAEGMDLRTAGPDAIRAANPARVRQALLLRLARLPAGAVPLARAIAVLGARTELPAAAALAGLDPDAAGRAADGLVAVELLTPGRPLRFVHPLVRETIYADVPASERALMHARAADVLAELGQQPAAIAPHLLAADAMGRPEVVETLRAAAASAQDQGAADVAARTLRRALAEPPSDEQRPVVLAELGTAEWLAGERPLEAVEHLRAATELATNPDERAAWGLTLLRAINATGDVVASTQELERQMAAMAECDGDALRRLEAELVAIELMTPETVRRAEERVGAYGELAGDTPGELLQVGNQAVLQWLRGSADEAAALAERALAGGRLLEDQESDSIAMHQDIWVLFFSDRHDVAAAALDRALADARARGSTFGFSTSCAMRAIQAWLRGDVRAVEAEARQGMEPAIIPPFPRPALFAYLATALLELGQVDEAEELINESGVGPWLPEIVPFNLAFFARGRLRLVQERFEEALEDFEETGRRDARIGNSNPGVPWRLGAVRALLSLGRRDEALALALEHEELARAWGTKTAIGAAVHGVALARDGAGLEDAVAALRESPARLDLAYAIVDLGRRQAREGDDDAADTLREGLELARECGATILVTRAHEELVAAGARPRRLQFSGVEALTASERRVAEMAAGGMSNRDIAQALFVTAKTVENQLGRCYGKLGIHSRGELAGALGEPAPA